MYKGIYIALSGAILKQKHIDVFAQNIANATTSGFKKGRVSFKDYLMPSDTQSVEAKGRIMTEVSQTATDFSMGEVTKTGSPLDLAINGKGFFVLEGERYTRNGNFKMDGDGYIVTKGGIKVLGSSGPISVQGRKIDINNSGEVFVDAISVDQLKVVDFQNKNGLKKLDVGVFTTDETGEEVNASVNQGYLESSNVNAMKEVVQMITSLREYEAYQKMIHAFDEATSKTTNQMGS